MDSHARNIVIIQARMGSTRMPGKTMKEISGKPILYYSVFNAKRATNVDDVVVATTLSPKDEVIVDWCKENDVSFYRGSEEDVLDRYYQAALLYKASIVIRITSDCPFIDPQITDMLIQKLIDTNSDYVSNRILHRSWPHGLDVEVFKFEALRKAWQIASQQREREHVTPYIREHNEAFKLIEAPLDKDLSYLRLTVDYPEDFELAKTLIENYQAHLMPYEDLIKMLLDNPELTKINQVRNDAKL